MARLPGQTSPLALLVSGLWTVLGLFVLIVGHLVWAFMLYGMVTDTDALKDLESFLPMLSQTYMYILAGLAVVADIWILISHKKERAYKIQR
jgi:hypothetical protein